jgi:serine/threonine protein kinase/TolB-like protein/tetratricopeptide (TPR) repeat protein
MLSSPARKASATKTVNPERWKQIEALCLSALEAPDRASFLAEACQGDVELRDEVEQLLKHESTTSVLMDRLAFLDPVDAPSLPDRELLTPGSALGPYKIVEWLGSGGSGDVYKAFDPSLDRYVALKVFANTAFTQDDRSRFIREARAAASLSHPNIATIYEVGEAERSCYISMEYVDGETFRQKLNEPECPLHERLAYLLQVARALEKAHASGIVHCDLKPDNIIVTRDGQVKILDFGLAKLVEGYRRDRAQAAPSAVVLPFASDHDGRIEGTVGYMSPEQVEGTAPLDARTDVFSFGCMLFEAIAHRLPFWHESVMRSLHSLLFDPTPRLSDFSDDASPELQAILDGCLEKDPARRWPGMEDVRQRLEGVLDTAGRERDRTRWAWPAAIAAAVLAGVVVWQWPQPAPASIAVIPFVNAQATPDSAYLADGISEGLIHSLAQLPDIKVIARTSSFRFAKDTLNVQEAARTLGVRALVTGQVAEANGRLTITAELIDGEDGRAIWGAEYSPSLADLADVQGQISHEIARRVQSQLTPTEERKLAKGSSVHPDAYALLLRGRYQMWLYNPASTQKAASFFEQALGIDPGFASAHAELANTYRRLGGAGILKPAEALPLAEQAALRAIAADDELAEAHAVLADIKRDRWEWDAAEHEYRRAIALSASLAAARQGLAISLSLMGRDEEAAAEARRARELDPVGLSSAIDTAAVFYNVRKYKEALDVLKSATSLDGFAPAIWTWIGIVNGGSGRFAEAIEAFEKSGTLGDNTAATRCYYVHALARAGRRRQALDVLDTILKSNAFVPPSSLAIAYVGLDQKDRAFELLEAGFAAHDPLLQYVFVESHLDALRTDSRFARLATKLGLPLSR